MRPKMLLCALALVMLPGAAHAQKTVTLSVPVTADVANGLSAFVENHLAFGTVLTGSGLISIPLTSPSAGLFRVQGRNNRTVDVTLTPPATLSNGVHTIPYTWQASSNNDENVKATATVRNTTTFQIQLKDHISGNVSNAYIWAYGSINLGTSPSSLSGGLYQGTFVLSVAY